MRRCAAAVLLLLTAAVLPCLAEDAGQVRLVFLVRHAEKSGDDPRDPNLSEAGRRRAEELARVLSAAGVTHLFSSEFRRTQQTLAPLAAERKLEVTVIAAREGAAQKQALLALPPGSVAVVAGHSNTVPGMAAALGGHLENLVPDETHGDMLGDEEYDRLFLLILPGTAGGVRTLELRYGE